MGSMPALSRCAMPDSPTEREAHNDALIRSFIDTFEND